MLLFESKIINQKVDAPWKQGGSAHWQFPALNHNGILEKKYLPDCSSCPYKENHDAVRDLYYSVNSNYAPPSYIEDEYRITKEDVVSLTQSVWVLGYIYYGVPYNLGYNSPDGGNISQEQTFEILSANGNKLTIKGINPNRVRIGDNYCHLPAGCMATFSEDSVLSVKCTPWVTKIESQDDNLTDSITIITLSESVQYAMTPLDLWIEQPDYRVTLRWFQNYPENWIRVEPDDLYPWSRKNITIEQSDLIENKYTYRGKILYPTHYDNNAFTVFSAILQNEIISFSVPFENLNVKTEKDVNGYKTIFDFSLYPNMVSASIKVLIPSLQDDENCVWLNTTCSNSRIDRSGSYYHGNERYCQYAYDEDGNLKENMQNFLDGYHDECYQPDCPGYTIKNRASNCNDSGWLERLVINGDLRIRQIFAGAPYAVIERVSGGNPSLALMAGFYYENVNRVNGVEWRELYNHATCGQRETFTDDLGYTRQRLVYGAFWARDEFDINDFSNSTPGLFPSEASIFGADRYGDGNLIPPDDKVMTYYPDRNMGGVHPYDYELTESGMCKTQMTDTRFVKSMITGFFNQEATEEQNDVIDNIRYNYK